MNGDFSMDTIGESLSSLDGPDWNTSHGLWFRFLVAAITISEWGILWIRMDLHGWTIAGLWQFAILLGVSAIAWFGFTKQTIADLRLVDALNSLDTNPFVWKDPPW
jgi:hypothetical protein